MAFQICTVQGLKDLDALPVAKIVHYPMEERDYRPFAQVVLCTDGARLILRMWAFEVTPPPGSRLKAVLRLFRDEPDRTLEAVFQPEESGAVAWTLSLCRGGAAVSPEGAVFRAHNGEDLQGVYWGGELTVPLEELERTGGPLLAKPGDVFPGNFYKLCDDPDRVQRGAWFPADWSDPFGPGSMGRCAVVDY